MIAGVRGELWEGGRRQLYLDNKKIINIKKRITSNILSVATQPNYRHSQLRYAVCVKYIMNFEDLVKM